MEDDDKTASEITTEVAEDIEDVNFIYAHPECKESKSRSKALDKLAATHDAEIVFDGRVNYDILIMSTTNVEEEFLLALAKQNPDEMCS